MPTGDLWLLMALCVVVASVPVVVCLRVASERSVARHEASAAIDPDRTGHISVHAADRGKPFLNLQDGREMSVMYRGNEDAVAALQNHAALSRSLASADFDHNGTPDVVAGYGYSGGGLITLQRGNPDAFAPASDAVFARLQQGYDPAPLLPWADVYRIPVTPDFLVTGNFTSDSDKDVLVAAKDGGLYLLAGDGRGGLDAPQRIALPGTVTALAAGQFRAADVFTDIAVGVSGSGGHSLLIFDGAATGFTSAVVQQPLTEPASAIEFGGLDDDPFMDVVAATGKELLILHGWGRKTQGTAASRIEHVNLGMAVRGLAVGEFVWDREGHSEIAALSEDGAIQILQNAQSDARQFTAAEAAERTRGSFHPAVMTRVPDVESLPAWQRGRADGWRQARWLPAGDEEDTSYVSAQPLLTSRLSYREINDLIVVGGGQPALEIVHPSGPRDRALSGLSAAGDQPSTILDTESAPVAVLALPRKLNGVTDVLMLSAASSALSVVPAAPNTTITVDRTDDSASASACTAAANDCSVRGAFAFANDPLNNNTTINIPAGTYILSINGASTDGCSDNSTGDLSVNQSMTVTGAGAASTIIRQTGTGPANDGDRVMCLAENFALDLVFDFSAFTITGGRDGASGGSVQVFGGGGIIGGEKGNALTLTNMILSNNKTVGPGLGGGAIEITGGDLTITNSTIGGTSAPGAYADRTSVDNANSTSTSGAGVSFTPSAPMHTGGTGFLTVTGSTFSRNLASSGAAGGGGADLYVLSFAPPGGIGTGSANIGGNTVFLNNQAVPANGGGIVVESLATTVAQTTFTNNAAGNRGGAIYVGGASLLLDGASPSVTLSGNTAAIAGSSISTASAVTVSGTNVIIGGDIEITTNGSWTNNAGSSLAPTNVVLLGGTLNMNNSTMNVGGNLSIDPGAVVGATFNGNTGTVNIAGNFTYNPGGSGPATSFNAGTGTFNFNGTGTQSISNGASITFNNLTDSNVTQPLTLNNSLAVNGTLNVNGANAILSPAAAAIISGTGTLTGTGTARASRIAATPDFLSQYTLTNKTLTNLAVDYNGAGAQTVNNTPAYSRLVISGSGTKTLQGNTTITGNLTINPSTLASGNFNFSLGGNWTNSGTFTPGTGTVIFAGTTGTQTLAGNTTFFNLTLNNSGATTNFGTATTTVGNDLTATAGTMDGGTSTVIFTGVTDNAGAIAGAGPKNFHSLQINSPATISNTTGGNITIENNYTNTGTFSQAAALTTILDIDNSSDGAHTLSGAGSTTFGNVTINNANTVDAGTHSFNVIGAAFTSTGTFTGNANTVSFNGGVPQSITGDGAKNFAGLLVNNANGVQVVNGSGAVDASVAQVLTLTTDLTVASGAILQQSGTSAGAADVLGTVRRTDLGVVARSFGNVNNAITINAGTPPTQLDLNLVKAAPGAFPATVKVVPRDITLTPTGGAGMSATVKLRYIDPAELTGPGITESRLVLWKNVGGVTWTPQGGTPDTAANFVSQTGISSFSEWAIAEGSDLTFSKANNVSGSAVTGQAWNWTLTASNSGAPATFAAGQTILSDNLPNSNLTYGTPTVQNVSNVSGSGNISCSIVAGDLTCTANGGSVTFDSNIGASSFDVVASATPQAAGTYQNPRTGGGIAQIDPNNAIAESNESNNSPTTNTVTVGKASTTTAITSDGPDPSVVGQPVTVQWSVTVNSPGSVATALTGNVTVSDGTNQCVVAVSAGQCDITFTSAGAKSLIATYAGDTNYNGSASAPATAHQVNKADTTTTITSDNPDPSTPGQSVIVQWSVTVNAPGAGTLTGNVTVSDGVDSCNALVATGQCTVILTTTGARTLTATYPGDTNFNTSADTESHAVCASTLVTTTADSGAGSLRQIIAAACDGATITFDSAGVFSTPQTITLTTGEILIDKNLTINAGSSRVTISGNTASRAFLINSGRTFSLIGLTFTAGSSANGGAILNDGTLTIVDSTLAGNASTADGGAVSNSATGALTLINTTISGNNASGNGGGVMVLGGTMTSINSTITNNRADNDNDTTGTGGGIAASSGTTTLKNTIVAGNFNEDGASDAADDISGTVDPASSFNLIGTGGSGGLINGVNNNQVGIASPGLGPLADNGGRTQTHALLSTSPAIETGSNANLPADVFDLDGDANTGETLPVDQRGAGFPRVADSADADSTPTVDIGAFELHPTIEDIGNKTTAEDTALPQFSFNIGDGTGALIASVTAASSNTALIPNANLVINGTGSTRTLDITPAANANTPTDGTATITVTVTATNGRTATDTFDVTVTEVNDPPAPANDTIGDIVEDCASGCSSGKYVIPFATLLGNDTNKGAANESGQTLTITAVGSPTGGTVAINGTNVEFTPAADFSGAAGFTYTVTDNGTTNGANDFKNGNATVSFNVTAVNDNPAVTTNTGITVITGSTSNTITGAMLSVTDVDNTAAQLTFTVGTAPVNGTLRKSGGALGSGGTFTQQDINGNLITYDHNGSATTTDNFSFTVSDGAGGSIGTTTFAITVTSQLPPNMSVQDSQLAEPASGTANMLFTVVLSAPAPATATVSYTTADIAPPALNHAIGGGACGAVDYVTTSGVLTFNTGEQFKTIAVPICADAIAAEPNDMFELKLSGAANATLVDALGIGTILAINQPGTLLISELRTSGPGGAADGFVEIYNNADTPLTVAASDASGGYGLYKQGATCDATPVLIATLPNGTVIPARGHYLLVGSQYSLADYGGTNAATGDVTMSSDIESDKNVAVFSTADVAAISSANRLDAVGFGTNTGNVCDLLREGTNLGAVSGSATQHAFFRKECAFVGGTGCTSPGTPKDTNDNSADLMFADTQGTFIPGIPQSLGAPGPQNLTSPLKRDLQDLGVLLLDGTVSNAAAPNRSRDFTLDPANNSTFGTLTIRRRVLNSTGAPVTRLRFRVVEITTFPPPAAGVADVRPRTSVDEVSMGPVNDAATCAATGTPATPPCNVLVKGLTLETPPAQPNGGGYNSTVSAGTITLVTPLAAGASVNVKFLLGIQAIGAFRFLIIVEALP